MKRTGFKKNRKRKCRVCREWFRPRSSFQKDCSPPCAIKGLGIDKAKKQKKEDKKTRERLKSRTKWLAEAQVECNKFIRERDKNDNCISCGKPPSENKFGGSWAASHFMSRAARPELRFCPLNIHKACSKCNSWLSGNIANYRKRLVEKIGLEAVEWLENYHNDSAWTIDDARELKVYFKEERKNIERMQS